MMISLIFLFFSSVICQSDIRSIKLTEISYNKLSSFDEPTVLLASQVLSSVGILKINSIPFLELSQNEAFSSLPICLESNADDTNKVFETVMNDGTRRLTIGAKSVNGVATAMSHNCGASSMSLRSIVDKTTQKLFQGLDYASSKNVKSFSDSKTFSMKPYVTFDDLLVNGEHLEHIHAFYNTKNSTNKSANLDEATLQMHTDAGLFIAMTTGYYSTSSNKQPKFNDQRGLFISLPSGEIVRVAESDLTSNDLIVMIGQGGADWLSPRLGTSFRAVPHSLVVDLGDDKEATRNWYGKMYFPPLDAELPSGETFEDFRDQQLKAVLSSKKFNQPNSSKKGNAMISVPVACGKSIHESGISSLATISLDSEVNLLTPEACTMALAYGAGPGIMCWMGCRSFKGLNCTAGFQPTCANTKGEAVDGSLVFSLTNTLQCLSVTTATPTVAPVTSSSSSSSCFAGSETVLLASGENKNIENVVIGDEILVSSLDGKKLSYSPVIAIPHAANNDAALFVVLDTESRRQLKLTGDHLVVGGDCGSVLSLVTADSLNINDCLLTTSGEDVITAITFVKGHGVYTVVTKDGALIVVNGIVASPFAVNHLLADSFYNIHRFLFKLVSFDFLNKFSMSVTNVFGDIVLSLF